MADDVPVGLFGLALRGESGSKRVSSEGPVDADSRAPHLIVSTTARSLRRVDRRRPCRSTPRNRSACGTALSVSSRVLRDRSGGELFVVSPLQSPRRCRGGGVRILPAKQIDGAAAADQISQIRGWGTREEHYARDVGSMRATEAKGHRRPRLGWLILTRARSTTFSARRSGDCGQAPNNGHGSNATQEGEPGS
jgi:hypothetical protein